MEITKDEIREYWDILKAVKEGRKIQLKVADKWLTLYPKMEITLMDGFEYRVKPEYEPKVGEIVLVKDEADNEWRKRIFIQKIGKLYYCLNGSSDDLLYATKSGDVTSLGYNILDVALIPWEQLKQK